MDKVDDVLMQALKEALTETGEQRLYRSGKLPGLLPTRSGVNAQAALKAIQDGLLEVVRTEVKGKTAIEWVRLTPRGLSFISERESPIEVLRDLHGILQTTRQGMPLWLADIRQQMNDFSGQVIQDVERMAGRLDVLCQRVEEVLRRNDALSPPLPESLSASIPWALDALAYLDRRQDNGARGDCSLPELFRALRDRHPELSVTAYHEGLRRMGDRRAVRLIPFSDPPEKLPEPEYALLDGSAVMFHVSRA